MPNPLTPQGGINRLIASLTFANNPALNITPDFLGTEAIAFNPSGPVTTKLGTLTGAVDSPEPYMLVGLGVHLVRSQPLANSYKNLIQTNASLGDGVLRPDVTTMDPYDLFDCSVTDVRPFSMTGRDAGFMITITGVWYINNSLWG